MNIINKSNNKKGFTLVELLVVIVILGIITAMSIPLIRNIAENGNERKYTTYSKSLVDSAKLYVNSYSKDLFGNNTTGCAYIKYSDLKDKSLVKDIQIENTSCNTDNTFIRVVKIEDKYSYVAQLGCGTVKNNKVNKVELRPNPGIVINTQCSTNPETKVTIEPTIKNETSLTKKSLSLQLKMTSLTGFQNNGALKLKYAWTTSSNSVGSNAEWKELTFPTTPSINEQKKQILANKEITLKNTNQTKIITPSGATGKYYLAVKPEVINDVSGNDILLNNKNNIIYFGPYIVDNTAPTVPNINIFQWKTNDANSKPTNKTTGLSLYTPGTWSGKKLIAVPSATDTIAGTNLTYKYTTTGKTTNEKDVISNYRNIEAEGESKIKFKACDKAGNCSAYSNEATVKIDLTPPTVSTITITSTNDKYNALTATAKITASDNIKENNLQMCISTSDYCSNWTTYTETSSITFPGSLDGKNRTLYVSIKDQSGNISKQSKTYKVYEECGDNIRSDENWINQGTCNKSCGPGKQDQISHTIDNYTNNACQATKSRKVDCNIKNCCDQTTPSYDSWSGWGSCSATCGPGTKKRTRTVTYKSTITGEVCSTSTEEDSTYCNDKGCCDQTTPSYGDWSGWGGCSVSCGGGEQWRSRPISYKSVYTGEECSTGTDWEKAACNTSPCNPTINCWRDGAWGVYGTNNGVAGRWYWFELTGYTSGYNPGTQYRYSMGYGGIVQQSQYQWYIDRYTFIKSKGQTISWGGAGSNVCNVVG